MYYADGSQRKPAKSKSLGHLNLNTVVNIPAEYSSIVDIGFTYMALSNNNSRGPRDSKDGWPFISLAGLFGEGYLSLFCLGILQL